MKKFFLFVLPFFLFIEKGLDNYNRIIRYGVGYLIILYIEVGKEIFINLWMSFIREVTSISAILASVLFLILVIGQIVFAEIVKYPVFDTSGLALIFVLLNLFVFQTIHIYNNNSTQVKRKREVKNWFYLLEFTIFVCLIIKSLFIFYIAFEVSLLIFFYLIYRLGSRSRKTHATLLLIVYTIVGSLFLIGVITYCFSEFGTTEITKIKQFSKDEKVNMILFFCLLIGFAVKVPIFPLHLWLLEAHVEAHTTTSVVLAAMILKLGGIGMIKFMLPFSESAKDTIGLQIALGIMLLGLVTCGFSIVQQIDLKKMVAYSSILHMNFSTFTLLILDKEAINGAIISMFAHGLTSAGLFFCIGMLYERYGTRNALSFGGLSLLQPVFSVFFFLFLLTNASFPLSVNFVGELESFVGIQERTIFTNLAILILITSTVLASFLLINRILFGNKLIEEKELIKKYSDLSGAEFEILIILLGYNIIFGVCLTGPLLTIVKSITI